MKRDERIPIPVTPEEKESLKSEAKSFGLSVSRLLRELGLRAQNFSKALTSLRHSFSKLTQLKRMSTQQQQLDASQVQAAVDEAMEALQVTEDSLVGLQKTDS